MSNSAQSQSFRQEPQLGRWLTETIGFPGMRLKLQIRGNDLRVLCEGNPCPKRTDIQLRLIPALQKINFNTLVPAAHPTIYRIQLYGRLLGQSQPEWKASIHLDQLDRHLEQVKQSMQWSPELLTATVAGKSAPTEAVPQSQIQSQIQSQPPADPFAIHEEAALSMSNRNLAKRGNELAIALYLSETLSELGVAVQVSAKTLAYVPPSSVHSPNLAPDIWTMKRLWVVCEAPYSPELSLISEPVTQKLRDLEIEGFRDAVLICRVLGETQPDWLLRVDLTPPGEMLRDWARWGDVEAIQRLLSHELQPMGFQISTAALNASTLHLVCGALPVPRLGKTGSPKPTFQPSDQKRIRAEASLFLEALAPQGIQHAAIYGQIRGQNKPAWVEWLHLPASIHPALAEPAVALAQQKDWGAIAYLLHRLLNPDLDQYLATGGIRLQLLPKQDVLHIMSEAYLCPDKQRVCDSVTRFLAPLQLDNLMGVRIYGRRSGEKQPLWQFASDFMSRGQLAPEAMPEFIATADYLNDLLPQEAAEQAIQQPRTGAENRLRALIQMILTRTQLFSVIPETREAIALPGQVSYQGSKVAIVWSVVGILLMLQSNWLLGQLLRTQPKQTVAQTQPIVVPPTPVASPSPSLSPAIPMPSVLPSPTADGVFNTSGFTQLEPPQPATKGSISDLSDDTEATTLPALPYTPPDPDADAATAALLQDSPLPTFNSRQLDEKLQLYYRYLEKFGTPDVLVVGSSRALRGIDPTALEEKLAEVGYPHVKVFNFGINGATAQVVDLLLQQILTPEQLPRVILWADGARALNSGTADVTYNGMIASPAYRELMAGTLQIPTAALSPDAPAAAEPPREGINQTLTQSYATIDRWFSRQLANISGGTYPERDRLKDLFKQQFAFLPKSFVATPVGIAPDAPAPIASPSIPALPALPSGSEPLMNADGFLSLPLQFNPATYYQKYAKVAGSYDSDYDHFQVPGVQENALRSVMQFAQTKKIPLVFVNLPLTDQYLDPVRLGYEQLYQQFMLNLSLSQTEGQPSGLVWRDLGDRWTTEYRYFSDPSHLNRYGAYAAAQQLAQDPLIPWVKGKQGKP